MIGKRSHMPDWLGPHHILCLPSQSSCHYLRAPLSSEDKLKQQSRSSFRSLGKSQWSVNGIHAVNR